MFINFLRRVDERFSVNEEEISLTHLYLMHLYRQNTADDVRAKINEISADNDFLEMCDYYDMYVMPNGMGSFRRAGIFAVAEKS
ncbi:MAG: hypothetical protein E7286_09305 [Lachnospiraceae bacterium]|nr:hypothetical protein [Lachnospiraceae bacterium]